MLNCRKLLNHGYKTSKNYKFWLLLLKYFVKLKQTFFWKEPKQGADRSQVDEWRGEFIQGETKAENGMYKTKRNKEKL